MVRRFIFLCALVLGGCGLTASAPRDFKPQAEANWTGGAMVVAANPLAVEAGLDVLRKGGSALDAAIAVQAVLGLVEPQSSGIGGGAFLVHYSAATGALDVYDGRETAPAGATPDMFLGPDGKPLDFFTAVKSGRSIGVPSVIAMLEMAHKQHGQKPWRELFVTAITQARNGFAVSPRLAQLIAMVQGMSPFGDDAAAYLAPGGVPLLPGQILKNEAYAQTLETIARDGAAAMREGPIAEAIIAAAQRGPLPGTLSPADLAAYQPRRLDAVCAIYRVDYTVCSAGPPSSGGIAVNAMLGMLQNFDLKAAGPTAAGFHLFIEAQRLAYADRDLFVADDRFVSVPVAGLLDPDYLKARAALIAPDGVMAKVEAGMPPGAPKRGADASVSRFGTTHFTVVDARGNVVSMTSTVESAFGSQRMAGGFFLNNQLTDFSFRPADDQGLAAANAAAAGKAPRSSMAPIIVFEDGRFLMTVGSPGGNAIPAYVAKVLIGVLDWGLTPAEAIALPNVVARRSPISVEDRESDALRAALTAMGHTLAEGGRAENSGLHVILRGKDGVLSGAADPRREGVAASP